MTDPRDYVELRTRSAFSFLEGAALPEDLADRAAALEYPAIAMGDRDGLYGAPRFYTAARKAGIKALVGAEITLDDDSRLYLLVPDRVRYQNLCRLISASKLTPIGETRSPLLPEPVPKYPAKGESRVTLEQLDRFGTGMICLAGGYFSPLSQKLIRGENPESLCDRMRGVFGAGNLFIDLQRHRDPEEERLNRKLKAFAETTRTPIVTTNDVCHSGAERALLDVLTCIRLKTSLDEAGRRLWVNNERYLKPQKEMAALFAD